MSEDGIHVLFQPAETKEEAIARLRSLTGTPQSSRGEKRAIMALRDGLGVEVATAQTNSRMGAAVADALGIDWLPTYTEKTTLSLAGLNALLAGASRALREGSLRRGHADLPPSLTGPEWDGYQPAQSKIEAVNRISSLTASGPEALGPGSKERKSVLVNLARHLAPDLDSTLSKTRLGRALAEALHAPWSDDCESTGETISLTGLNVLLAGAERRLGVLGRDRSMTLSTPAEEGQALVSALVDEWQVEEQRDGSRRVLWDGKECIRWMADQGFTGHQNQSEWPGFYFEARGRAALNRAFTPKAVPKRVTYGRTSFDYSLEFVWDLKSHTTGWYTPSTGKTEERSPWSLLNDCRAMDDCTTEQGLGFLVLSGMAVRDEDGSFASWHREFKQAAGVRSRNSNSRFRRQLKAAFEPERVEAVYFPDHARLLAAIAGGVVKTFAQGKQAPSATLTEGAPRALKYQLNLNLARADGLVVAAGTWTRLPGRR